MTRLTREIGEFVAGLRLEAIPDQAVSVIRNGFTDCVGVTIAGRNEDIVRILRTVLNVGAASGESRICCGPDCAPASLAALVNGAAAHVLDYDDIGLNGLQPTHPSAVLVPAILAEGQALHRSGRDMIEAYAAGFEVWGELASRERNPYHVKGWHPTATFGAIAAAAAAAKLHRLTPDDATRALAIAASQAGGLVANFGSMTKSFHAGRAASTGILSARLAAAGMTASMNALEHKQGFLSAMSPAGDFEVDTPVRLGKHWWLVADGLGFKLYPMCYGTHRALDGMIALAREHQLSPEEIADINVEVTQAQVANLIHHDPQTGLDGKFSMEFAAAAAIIARRVSLAEVSDEFVQRADVRALMKKVRMTFLPAPAPLLHRVIAGDGAIVSLKDGTRLERRFDLPVGHPKRPVDANTLWTKFADCTRDALDEDEAKRFFALLQRLETVETVDEFPVTGSAIRQ